MMSEYINLIVIIVVITFLFGLFYLNKQNSESKLLFYILSIYFTTEIVTIFSTIYDYNFRFFYNVSVAFQFFLWLALLLNVFKKQKRFVILTFTVLITISFIISDGGFNKTNFLIGSFLYLIIYIYCAFQLLKSEAIAFFQSNQFILISSPILFFLGLSFMFAFKFNGIATTAVFLDLELYQLVNYFVNIIFYSLINIYIFKERKLNA